MSKGEHLNYYISLCERLSYYFSKSCGADAGRGAYLPKRKLLYHYDYHTTKIIHTVSPSCLIFSSSRRFLRALRRTYLYFRCCTTKGPVCYLYTLSENPTSKGSFVLGRIDTDQSVESVIYKLLKYR